MISLLTIPNARPLWQNKKWSIEKIKDCEIAITDGCTVYYAYISEDLQNLVVDRMGFPKYIEAKALKLAQKHIESVYADY